MSALILQPTCHAQRYTIFVATHCCCETELTKQTQFSLHDAHVRGGSLFRTSVYAFVSNGWVQPSQAISTPTLFSSSLSWCLLTHTMPSLFSPHALPLTLSAVAMLLLCFASKKNERKQERKEKYISYSNNGNNITSTHSYYY